MSIAQLKLQNFNEARKTNEEAVSNSLSRLNAQVILAMKQQAYMHLDPDANGADDLISVVSPTFATLASEFNSIAAMLNAMQEVAAGTLTAADLVSTYSLDLTEFSDDLL